jgi:hypothetical protein
MFRAHYDPWLTLINRYERTYSSNIPQLQKQSKAVIKQEPISKPSPPKPTSEAKTRSKTNIKRKKKKSSDKEKEVSDDENDDKEITNEEVKDGIEESDDESEKEEEKISTATHIFVGKSKPLFSKSVDAVAPETKSENKEIPKVEEEKKVQDQPTENAEAPKEGEEKGLENKTPESPFDITTPENAIKTIEKSQMLEPFMQGHRIGILVYDRSNKLTGKYKTLGDARHANNFSTVIFQGVFKKPGDAQRHKSGKLFIAVDPRLISQI